MEFENLLKLIQAVSDSELTGLKYEPLHRQHRHLLPLRQQGQKNRKWKGTS